MAREKKDTRGCRTNGSYEIGLERNGLVVLQVDTTPKNRQDWLYVIWRTCCDYMDEVKHHYLVNRFRCGQTRCQRCANKNNQDAERARMFAMGNQAAKIWPVPPLVLSGKARPQSERARIMR